MTMSDMASKRRVRSMPRAVRVFRVMLSLLELVSLKWPLVLRFTGRPSGVPAPVKILSPRVFGLWGHSTLITSAPSAPSHRVHQGPARTQVKSNTRIPDKAPGVVGASAPACTMGSPPGYGCRRVNSPHSNPMTDDAPLTPATQIGLSAQHTQHTNAENRTTQTATQPGCGRC